MNCSFKILWFEDDNDWQEDEEENIRQILKKHYLSLEICRKFGDDYNENDIKTKKYDLILMDYRLQGNTGDAIITSIRNNEILTDILFYSSELKTITELVKDNIPLIDGIYITKRTEGFSKKVEKIILKIIKRSEDIINLRGFVMDGTCDFEVRIKNMLNMAWERLDDEDRILLEQSVEKEIDRNEKRDKDTKNYVLKQTPIFLEANNNKYFFSITDRLYLLTKVIKICVDKYHLECTDEILLDFKRHYEKDISQYRNALAHKKQSEEKIVVANNNTENVDEALHNKLRNNINIYNSKIAFLQDFINKI